MKRNLNRIFESWNPSSMPSSPIHMQALFVLAWFHAVVQVRILFCFYFIYLYLAYIVIIGKKKLRASRMAKKTRIQRI